ncbi:MAG TPA: secretin N-terminal domain-containing protein, partial [Phycisphaerae bacterium]|nr:secretin N-terminal domain-containing protein [Phycisphaerae bacterium]
MMNLKCTTRSGGAAYRPGHGGASSLPAWAALAAVCLCVLPVGQATGQEPATQPATATAPAPAEEPATQPGAASRPTSLPAGEGLLMNFQNASLQAVLEYLSETAGLVILNGAEAEGRITIMSRKRVDTNEAIALLDTILKEKGYTAIRTGRLLKIVTLAQAAKENLPVHSGSDPLEVPISDKLVTQIIPIRYADAMRLRTDLTPLLSVTAALTANQASNSLILIDTQTNIRRIMQVIRALDGYMAGEGEVKIYQLKYADAVNTSRLITELFKQDQAQGQGQRVFMPFGRIGGGRRGPGNQQQPEDQAGGRQQKVVAAADERTNTLVVSAPPDLLKVIDTLVKELDSDPTEEQSVFIYPLKNAQATNLETVLRQIFAETGTTVGGRATGGRATVTQTRRRFGAAAALPAGAGAGDLAGQVFIVADADTNSLIVRTAAKYVERVKEILTELDRPIRQVLIKVLI